MWGEVKRANSCKGVSFSGSAVARSLPGIQLIVAWRVGVMRAVATRNTELLEAVAPGIADPDGSSAPCHAVPFRACVQSARAPFCSREKFTYERTPTPRRKIEKASGSLTTTFNPPDPSSTNTFHYGIFFQRRDTELRE